MAWEQRGNRTYYYRSVRSGTRITKEYAGGGFMGALASEYDTEQREQRQHEQEQRLREHAHWSALEAQTRELSDMSDLLLTAALVQAGYHRHDRGEWRRRRG